VSTAGGAPLVDFFEQGQTVENKLHNTIIPLFESGEVETLHNRFVHLHSSVEILRESTTCGTDTPGVEKDRIPPIFLVLGASGSGKTFFSLKYAATFGLPEFEGQQYTTWYLKPPSLDFFRNERSPGKLMDWVKRTISSKVNAARYQRLNMHVTLVLDEAGDSRLDGYFDKLDNLNSLLEEMKKLATSVRLVVCGTGITGQGMNTGSDVSKFRMKNWGPGDLEPVSEKLGVEATEMKRKELIDAILAQPALTALGTNGRSAFFTLIAIHVFSRGIKSDESWKTRLKPLVGPIVEDAVTRYILANSLRNLCERERRRVAAFILCEIDRARKEKTIEVPSFIGLRAYEKPVAMSLIDFNIEPKSNVSTFARDEAPSVVLASPAILVVLWVLLGIPAGLLADCNVQEPMTALYAFGKQVKEYMGLYLDRDPKLKALRTALKDGLSDEVKAILAELQAAEHSRAFNEMEAQSSAELDTQIVSLKLVQSGNEFPIASSSEAVVVPRLNATDIWICSNEFAFASVVAPFVLYRCKRHSARTDDIQVNLTKERWNCGLLKPNKGEVENSGWITLRWLFGIWTGKLSSAAKLGSSAASKNHLLRTELRDLQSDFYPFQLACCEQAQHQHAVWNRPTG
jgi:hypothetical protein